MPRRSRWPAAPPAWRKQHKLNGHGSRSGRSLYCCQLAAAVLPFCLAALLVRKLVRGLIDFAVIGTIVLFFLEPSVKQSVHDLSDWASSRINWMMGLQRTQERPSHSSVQSLPAAAQAAASSAVAASAAEAVTLSPPMPSVVEPPAPSIAEQRPSTSSCSPSDGRRSSRRQPVGHGRAHAAAAGVEGSTPAVTAVFD